MWRTLSLVLAALALAHALPAQEAARTDNELEGAGDCLRKDSTACLERKIVSFVDKMLGQRESISLADGVTVVRSAAPGADTTGAPRAMEPGARLRRVLDSHSLRVELRGGDVADALAGAGRALEDAAEALTGDSSATEEGRGKKKKAAKLLGPLLAAVALKAAAILPLVLGAIALIAGKALLIGKLALVLSAVIGLKKLLSQQKHVTYEVVAHPHHSSSHTSSHSDFGASSGYGGDSAGYGGAHGGGGGGGSSGGGGGWGRSYPAQDAQAQAYAAQTPAQ